MKSQGFVLNFRPKVSVFFPEWLNAEISIKYCKYRYSIVPTVGGRRSPAVACWASDHWVASSNPLRGKFRH